MEVVILSTVHRKLTLLFMGLALAVLWSGCAKKSNTQVKAAEDLKGKLVVTVVDKSTGKTISGAKIIVSGTDDTYNTNEKGMSDEIEMKVNKDFYKKYGDSLAKKAPSGSATILITKDGYKDCIVFNRAIYSGRADNTMKVEMIKLSKNDKQKYVWCMECPHEVWVEELVGYCKNIKNQNAGSGQNKLTVAVKGQGSKAIAGASVIIPEMGLKVVTDKNGKATLNPVDSKDVLSLYPVSRESSKYTVVVIKDGYVIPVIFNTSPGSDKTLNVTLKAASDPTKTQVIASCQLDDDSWVEKVISSMKQQVPE